MNKYFLTGLTVVALSLPLAVSTPAQDTGRPIREPRSGEGCDCPYDKDKRGYSCGKRSAYNKPKGKAPACYSNDSNADSSKEKERVKN